MGVSLNKGLSRSAEPSNPAFGGELSGSPYPRPDRFTLQAKTRLAESCCFQAAVLCSDVVFVRRQRSASNCLNAQPAELLPRLATDPPLILTSSAARQTANALHTTFTITPLLTSHGTAPTRKDSCHVRVTSQRPLCMVRRGGSHQHLSRCCESCAIARNVIVGLITSFHIEFSPTGLLPLVTSLPSKDFVESIQTAQGAFPAASLQFFLWHSTSLPMAATHPHSTHHLANKYSQQRCH